jgi:hypothetical protein
VFVKCINLTEWHNVVLLVDGEKLIIPPSGKVVRINYSIERREPLYDAVTGFKIPVIRKHIIGCENLPPPEDGVIYIVSAMVRHEFPSRQDLMSPDTGPTACKDSDGHVVSVQSLVQNINGHD